MYVYRYKAGNEIVYVGIANNLKRRVDQHKRDKRDKLSTLKEPVIEYFCVQSRTDAELLETYFINKYKTGRFFNIKKANRGDVHFLDGVEIPWEHYSEDNIKNDNFIDVAPPKKVVEVEKIVYRKKQDSTDAIVAESDEFYRQKSLLVASDIDICHAWINEVQKNIGYFPEERKHLCLWQAYLKLLYELRDWDHMNNYMNNKARNYHEILTDIAISQRKINKWLYEHFGIPSYFTSPRARANNF